MLLSKIVFLLTKHYSMVYTSKYCFDKQFIYLRVTNPLIDTLGLCLIFKVSKG